MCGKNEVFSFSSSLQQLSEEEMTDFLLPVKCPGEELAAEMLA